MALLINELNRKTSNQQKKKTSLWPGLLKIEEVRNLSYFTVDFDAFMKIIATAQV